jgi:hypothetical protein
VRARTHTCDVRSHVCVCVRNPFWKVCEMCVRADLFWACDVRSHFCTLFETKSSIFWQFVPKSVQKCDRTSHAQKRSARTHISHTFQNGFRTHTHTCDRTSHMCVRARLRNSYIEKYMPCALIPYSTIVR